MSHSQYGTSVNGSPSPRASTRKGDTERMRTSTLTGRKGRDLFGGRGAAEASYLAGRSTNLQQQDNTENDMSGFSTINVSTLRRRRSPSPALSTVKRSGPLFTSRASRRRLLPKDEEEGDSSEDDFRDQDQTQVPNTVDVRALEDFSELSVVQQYKDDPKYSSQLANSIQSHRNSVNASRNHRSIFDETQQTQIPATPAVDPQNTVRKSKHSFHHSLFDETQKTQIPATPAVGIWNSIQKGRRDNNSRLFDETQQTQVPIPATPSVLKSVNRNRSHHSNNFDETQETQIPASPTSDLQNSPGYERRLVEEAARENAAFRFSTFRREPQEEDSTLHGADFPSFHFSSPIASSTPRAPKLNGKPSSRNSFIDNSNIKFNNTYADEDEDEADATVLPVNQGFPSPPSSPPPIPITENGRTTSRQSSIHSRNNSLTTKNAARRGGRGGLDPIQEMSGGRSFLKANTQDEIVKVTETPPQTVEDKVITISEVDVGVGEVTSDQERRSMIRNALEWKGSSTRSSRGNRFGNSKKVGGGDSTVIPPALSKESSVAVNRVLQDEPTETLDWLNAANFATPQVRSTGSGVFGNRNFGFGFGQGKVNSVGEDEGDETVMPEQRATSISTRSQRPASRAARISSPPPSQNKISLFSTTLRDLPDPSNISPPRQKPQSPKMKKRAPSPPPQATTRRDILQEEESTADVTKEMEIEGTPVVVLRRSRRNREPSISPEEVAANETVVRDAMSALSRVQSPAASEHTAFLDRKGKGKADADVPREHSQLASKAETIGSRPAVAEKLNNVSSHRPMMSYITIGRERERNPPQTEQAPATQPLERPPSRGKQRPTTTTTTRQATSSPPKRWTRLSDALSPRKDRRSMAEATATSNNISNNTTNNSTTTTTNNDSNNSSTSGRDDTTAARRRLFGNKPEASNTDASSTATQATKNDIPPPIAARKLVPPPRPRTPESQKNKAHLYDVNNLESPTNSDYEAFKDDEDGVEKYMQNISPQKPVVPQKSQQQEQQQRQQQQQQPEQKPVSYMASANTNSATTTTPTTSPGDAVGSNRNAKSKATESKPVSSFFKTSLRDLSPVRGSGSSSALSSIGLNDKSKPVEAPKPIKPIDQAKAAENTKPKAPERIKPMPSPDEDTTDDSIVNLIANDTDYQSLLGIQPPQISSDDEDVTVDREYQISPITLPRRTKSDEEIESNPQFIRRLKEAEVALLGKMNNKLQTLQLELRSTKRGIETIEKRLEEQDGGEEFDPDATGFADQTVTEWTEDEKADLRKAIEENKVLTAKRILEERIKRSNARKGGKKKKSYYWGKAENPWLFWAICGMAVISVILALELLLLLITARVPCRAGTEFTNAMCTLRSLPVPGFMLPVDGLPYLPLGSPLLGILYNNFQWLGRIGLQKVADWVWEVVMGWWGLLGSLVFGLWKVLRATLGLVTGLGPVVSRIATVLSGIGSFLVTLLTPNFSSNTSMSTAISKGLQSTSPATSKPMLSNAALGDDEEIVVYNAGLQGTSSSEGSEQKKDAEEDWWGGVGSGGVNVIAKEYDPRTGQARDPVRDPVYGEEWRDEWEMDKEKEKEREKPRAKEKDGGWSTTSGSGVIYEMDDEWGRDDYI